MVKEFKPIIHTHIPVTDGKGNDGISVVFRTSGAKLVNLIVYSNQRKMYNDTYSAVTENDVDALINIKEAQKKKAKKTS